MLPISFIFIVGEGKLNMFREKLISSLQLRAKKIVASKDNDQCEEMQRKQTNLSDRNAEIVKVQLEGKIIDQRKKAAQELVSYDVHKKFVIKQESFFYIEEGIERRTAIFQEGEIISDEREPVDYTVNMDEDVVTVIPEHMRVTFHYDRLKAIQYAERWWNDYNPAYRSFDVDCTNYISQCLHAGGAPMIGYPNRSKGWWMKNNNWSYSWTVAHAFRWYLPTAKSGLRAKEVNAPEQLMLGDVICYDFEGDGRYDHTTIVTGKDAYGMPLVNAHTDNSRMRYWSYEDSTAYTENIQYKFFTIIDDVY